MGERPISKINKFSPLGWLLGALSLLNLIEDLTPLVLFGKLKKWIDAYSQIVLKFRDFIFGGIDFAWISMSEIEMHVIIIASIFVAAFSRAIYNSLAFHNNDRIGSFFEMIGATLVLWVLVLLPPLLLPGLFGFLGIIIGLLIGIGVIYVNQEEGWPKLVTVFCEMIGTTSVFIILVALNYTLF